MLICDEDSERELRKETIDADLVVVGGGMAGCCAAITAARQGLHVVLVQDRPVLGGNTSSEVRLWMVGATSHMGNNNRWAREGGVLNEILVENSYRNPEGNPILFDSLLLEKVVSEPTLRLLLNTAAHEVIKRNDNQIESVVAFCSQNSTSYLLHSPLFCDASGDGIVGFLSGAAFRIGVESQDEFGELLAPTESSRQLLGHSIYFYTRDTGRPVKYVAPDFALSDITKIPRYRRFNTKEHGTDLWWIEYGGSLDTIHESEEIKWELWKIIYGVWDHIKNSGEFPDSETLTIDWIGLIPGKRESRRFEGDYMLVQQDVVEQRTHNDAVSFGGWAIDHHPVDNIYSKEDPCTQWHSMGVYQIPYRTMYSRNVTNLFCSGRLLSASHIAFGSSRVMATCGHNGQAIGVAAALCKEHGLQPRELCHSDYMQQLQLRLLRTGQHIPLVKRKDPDDLAQKATVSATSHLQHLALSKEGTQKLNQPRALLLPMSGGRVPEITLYARHQKSTTLTVEIRNCSRLACFTPDVVLERIEVELTVDELSTEAYNVRRIGTSDRELVTKGNATSSSQKNGIAVSSRPLGHSSQEPHERKSQWVDSEITLSFETELPDSGYAFICLDSNPDVEIYQSNEIITGLTTVTHRQDSKVAKASKQLPPAGSGIDEFEYWTAERRPRGKNLSVEVELDNDIYAADNVINGYQRPTTRANAWVASPSDKSPNLTLQWSKTEKIEAIQLVFDPDWDHPMENIIMHHQERVMPTTVQNFRIFDADNHLVAKERGNHATIVTKFFSPAIHTDQLTIELEHPSSQTPASLFEVRCYADKECC